MMLSEPPAATPEIHLDKLCEINVIEQVLNAGADDRDAGCLGARVEGFDSRLVFTASPTEFFRICRFTLNNPADLYELNLKMIERQKENNFS